MILNANSQTGVISTTLGSDTSINSLNVNGNGTNTIAAGSTLTINAAADSNTSSDSNYTGNAAGQGIVIASAANAFTINAGVTLGGTQKWTNNSANTFTVGGAVAGSASTGARTLTLQNTGAGDTVISGAISDGTNGGNVALVVNSSAAGLVQLSGVNTYTGSTTITAGTLRINGGSQLNNGTYAGNISIASANGGKLIYNSSANQTLSGAVTGAGALTMSGSNTLTISSNSTNYSGATTISSGTLALSFSAANNSFISPIVVNSGATLLFSPTAGDSTIGGASTVNLQGAMNYSVSSSSAYQIWGGLVTVNAPSTIATTGVAGGVAGLYLDGGLAGSANLTVTSNTVGVGLSLRNNNVSGYTGTMTVNGTASTANGGGSGLVVGNRGTNATMPNTNLTLNGTLEMGNTGMGLATGSTSGQTFQINALAGTGAVVSNWLTGTNTTTLSVGNNGGGGTFSGVIADGTSDTLSFIKNGAGTQVLSGVNTYTGATTINAGTLKMDLTSRTDTTSYIRLGAVSIGATGTLELFNTNSTIDNPTGVIANVVASATSFTGSGTINKTGAGYVDFFTQANLSGFTGTINVNSGTLASNGGNWGTGGMTLNIAPGTVFDDRTGAVTVNRLTGSGTVQTSNGAQRLIKYRRPGRQLNVRWLDPKWQRRTSLDQDRRRHADAHRAPTPIPAAPRSAAAARCE